MYQVHLDQKYFFSGSRNFAVFAGGSSDFFEIAAKVFVFGFVAVDVLGVVVGEDDDISDAVVVAAGLNLLLVRVVLS